MRSGKFCFIKNGKLILLAAVTAPGIIIIEQHNTTSPLPYYQHQIVPIM